MRLRVPGLPFRLRLLKSFTAAFLFVPLVGSVAVVALLVASFEIGGFGWQWYAAWSAAGTIGFAGVLLMNCEITRIELFDYEQSEGIPDDLAVEFRDAEEYDAKWQAEDRLRDERLREDEQRVIREAFGRGADGGRSAGADQ